MRLASSHTVGVGSLRAERAPASPLERRETMATARVTEIVASAKTIEKAIEEGVKRATKTLRGVTAAEVTRIQAKIEKNKIKEYRVAMNLTFVLDV
jgi:flavin-binding protein dodecin